MTSCQALYCINEKGKCERIFFFVNTDQDYCTLVNTSTSDHKKTQENTTTLATKKEKAYVRIKQAKSDSYVSYGQSCKTWNYT